MKQTMNASTTKAILIVASIVYGLAFIPSVLFAMMSPMVADGKPPIWLMGWIVFGCAAIPLSMLMAVAMAWMSYRKSLYTRAVILTVLPITVCLFQFIGIAILEYGR